MRRLLLIIGLTCASLYVYGKPMHVACDDEVSLIQSYYSISFGDTIEAGIISEHDITTTWSVLPQTGVSRTSGSGKTTGDLVFSEPGEYEITVKIPAHGNQLAKTETIKVHVSAIRMEFDTEKVSFSRKLAVGDVSGTEMTIPVLVKTYQESEQNYSAREVKTTGVAQISSHLKHEKKVLKAGWNILSFELAGTINQRGNIQFRVYDADGNPTFFNYTITD